MPAKNNSCRTLGSERGGAAFTAQCGDPLRQQGVVPLKTISCPECSAQCCTNFLRLKVKYGFSNSNCKSCRTISPTANWRCGCSTLWFKGFLHEHQNAVSMKRAVVGIWKQMRKKEFFDPVVDIDRLMPNARQIEHGAA